MNNKLTTAAALETPTRVRYGVLSFVCTLSMITYLDRVCFGVAGSEIMQSLGLTGDATLNWFTWAFAISYAVFEVPTGWLGDVFGPRKTLIRIVLWWSFFTVVTGLVGLEVGGLVLGGFWTMLAVRFLFGMGEAGAYPNITRALHNWFPYTERAFAQGAVWMSGRLMGGLTPLVWFLVTQVLQLSWRSAFALFGFIGVLWCLVFAVWFRNRPHEKPSVNPAERELIEGGRTDTEAGHAKVPWGKLLGSANLWFLCLMYFCAAYGWYFNISLLPRFLETQYGVAADSPLGSIYKGGPLWMGAITCLIGGWLSDRFIRRTGDRKWGRRLFGIIGHGLCALCYFGCFLVPKEPAYVFWFFLSISMAAFWNDLTMGAAWAVCQDIGKRYSAIVAGCMNTIGNLGGAVTQLVTGFILMSQLNAFAAARGVEAAALNSVDKAAAQLPGYQINFAIYTAVYVIAVFFWLRVDATKPLVEEEH